ncbi:MAG: hypothetical protein HQ518_26295 [Rhodopirellula sp.]|nr:hypothetical protein [Rhodopirellula sp.]
MTTPSSPQNTAVDVDRDAETTAARPVIDGRDPVLTSHGVPRESEAATVESLRERLEQVERQIDNRVTRISEANGGPGPRTIRIRSERTCFGYPIYDIAFGPDLQNGTRQGHARGIFAFGDRATGIVAVGGLAQGVIAIGGLSWGLFTVGGCTLGLIAGVGGVAAGGIVLGGVAMGVQAFGGVAMSVLPLLSAMFSSAPPNA